MGRRRSHERRDLPPNLYIRNNGYYCYRDPRTGKEFGLGRDRRIAITEAIQANIELSFTKPISLSFDANASVRHHMQILTCILNPLTSNPVIAMRNDVDSY